MFFITDFFPPHLQHAVLWLSQASGHAEQIYWIFFENSSVISLTELGFTIIKNYWQLVVEFQ